MRLEFAFSCVGSPLYPSEAKVSVAGQESKAMADQLATVAKERLSKQLGVLSKDDLRQVERVLKIQPGLQIEYFITNIFPLSI